MSIVKYILTLAVSLASTSLCLAQNTEITPPERIFLSQEVPETGKVVVPESPIISMSGVYEDSEIAYICNIRKIIYQLQILIYYNLDPADMLVVIDDNCVDDYTSPCLFADEDKNDKILSASYGVLSDFQKGDSFLSISKTYMSGYTESAKTNFSFRVARLGEIVSYELKPANDAYETLDAYLDDTDFSGKTATEAAAELTTSLYCKAVDVYGNTWDLLCPVTSWNVNISKKTASFSPVLVIKEFESFMSTADINGAQRVNLSSQAPASLSFSIDRSALNLTETAARSTTVSREPGAIIVSGSEADIFSLDGRLAGRTTSGRLNVPAGFYIVRADNAKPLTVIVK